MYQQRDLPLQRKGACRTPMLLRSASSSRNACWQVAEQMQSDASRECNERVLCKALPPFLDGALSMQTSI
jgi:hypothetical protein